MESGTRKLVGALVTVGGVVLIGTGVALLARRRSAPLGRVQIASRSHAGGMTLTHYRQSDLPIKERISIIQDLTAKSVEDPRMRHLALAITGHGGNVEIGSRLVRVAGARCPARDGLCESRAIYDWVRKNVRYTGDVAPHKLADGKIEAVDLFQRADRTVEFAGGDCLPAGTLLLVEGHRLVPIEQVVIGSRIWGLDRWTEVKDIWFKGLLPVDAVFMNNGSSFKATGDHHVYVALCKQHPVRWEGGKTCSCPMNVRNLERINVADLEEGMVLPQPDRLPFGTETMDADRAYVEGLYLSDGWSEENRFAISGRDGCPKEAQKREVQEICTRLGVATRWNERYLTVNDREWAQRLQSMGKHARFKHALSINLDEGAAAALLRGIMADSGANTNGPGRTFTTTSRELMLQTRILHRMFGLSCGERYVVDHGGLGEHPIWRLQVRTRPDQRKDAHAEKLLRVKAIERNVMSLPTYDLTTEDHRVYLPEADVTVSQCDDHAILSNTLLTHNGITARNRVTSRRRGPQDDYSHIYTVALLPKNNPTKAVAVDTTLPGNYFGVEAGHAKRLDFPA